MRIGPFLATVKREEGKFGKSRNCKKKREHCAKRRIYFLSRGCVRNVSSFNIPLLLLRSVSPWVSDFWLCLKENSSAGVRNPMKFDLQRGSPFSLSLKGGALAVFDRGARKEN